MYQNPPVKIYSQPQISCFAGKIMLFCVNSPKQIQTAVIIRINTALHCSHLRQECPFYTSNEEIVASIYWEMTHKVSVTVFDYWSLQLWYQWRHWNYRWGYISGVRVFPTAKARRSRKKVLMIHLRLYERYLALSRLAYEPVPINHSCYKRARHMTYK